MNIYVYIYIYICIEGLGFRVSGFRVQGSGRGWNPSA